MCKDQEKMFTVNGRPTYQTIRLIGEGGTSRCYQVRKIESDGTLGRYYVIKEFYPQTLREHLTRVEPDGQIALKPGSEVFQEEFDALLRLFWEETDRCAAINHSAGEGNGNFPWVFQSQRIPGRDDLLLIDTENGYTIADFVKNQYSGRMSARYVSLCLTIASRMLESLKGIHRNMLHLDIKPQNVYIVTQDSMLSPSSAFSIKLLDLASAVSKSFFAPETFSAHSSEWQNATYSEGYTDPAMQRLWDAMETGMLDRFWKWDKIDQRTDWYSVGAILYYMLTRIDGFRDGQAYVALPRTGLLENDAIRSDLEELLSRALKLAPYTESEIEEHKFLQDVNRLLYIVQYSAALKNQPEGGFSSDAPSVSPNGRETQSVELLPQAPSILEALDEKQESLEELLRFSAEEEAEYRQQIDVLCQCLPESEDRLKYYTCHSLPHVQEVISETETLFQALRPWLAAYIPSDEMEPAHRRLLLAAKLHDIGMAGTPAMRQLAETIDRLYCLADSPLCTAKELQPIYARLTQLAKAADYETEWLDFIVQTPLNDSPATVRQLKKALARYHDAVKKAIRNRHAEASGRYILEHRETLAAHCGQDVDWAETALLAALHSNSARDHIEATALNGTLSKAYCQLFLREYGTPDDENRLCERNALIRIFAEATILRLADARRSGKNLCMMDLSPLEVQRTPGGRYTLYQVRHGLREPISFNESREIILSEACCDMGGVTLQGNEAEGRQIIHSLRVKYCQDETVRALFRDLRIPALMFELSSALLTPTQKMRHVFQVSAEGIGQAEADAWAESFHLPAGYAVIIQPEKGGEEHLK